MGAERHGSGGMPCVWGLVSIRVGTRRFVAASPYVATCKGVTYAHMGPLPATCQQDMAFCTCQVVVLPASSAANMCPDMAVWWPCLVLQLHLVPAAYNELPAQSGAPA
jgi:hypothetical protein